MLKSAYFAGGCFWGVEYYFETFKGVQTAISGYMGGDVKNPTYDDICTGSSGHYETVQVNYDENIVSYDELAMHFFEIHNCTQKDGQGPDRGSQYMSAVFYENDEEKDILEDIINELKRKLYKVQTKLIQKDSIIFYKAEDYHQNYYFNNFQTPYCHKYKKIF